MIETIIRRKEDLQDKMKSMAGRLEFSWDFDVPVHVVVKPYQDVRSRAQNNLYWKWLGILAQELSSSTVYTKDDMHDLMRHKYLGTEEVQIGTEVITRLPSTTKLAPGKMAEYMGRVEAWSADHGVLVPLPEDNVYMTYREASQ